MTQPTASSAGTIGNPSDPWSLSSTNYSQENFYVRATDGNGHDATLQTKVSPALLGEIQRLVQSREIPQYRTYADLVRDALVHRLRYLADEYPGAVNLHALEIEQRQAEVDRVLGEREAWDKLLTDLERTLAKLIQLNELDEAEWLMEQNEYNESMSLPYLARLNKTLGKYRAEVRYARENAQRDAGR